MENIQRPNQTWSLTTAQTTILALLSARILACIRSGTASLIFRNLCVKTKKSFEDKLAGKSSGHENANTEISEIVSCTCREYYHCQICKQIYKEKTLSKRIAMLTCRKRNDMVQMVQAIHKLNGDRIFHFLSLKVWHVIILLCLQLQFTLQQFTLAQSRLEEKCVA